MPENEHDLSPLPEESHKAKEDSQGAGPDTLSRRAFVGAAALASAGFMTAPGLAQTRQQAETGREDDNTSDPGPEDQPLVQQNPSSYIPPFTDTGNPGPVWYSFDITPKRLEGGGWTHQVTERELPPSKDLAGVNMRLTAGSFRELHWHLAGRVVHHAGGQGACHRVCSLTVRCSSTTSRTNDLWYFPAGFPHSIQGLEGEGCEFLLVFDQGNFSEDDTFLLSEFLAHIPPEIVQKNMGWTRQEWDQLPRDPTLHLRSPTPRPA